ncbi:GroES family chaperonin [Bradyrhizobium sp. 930_D9_N1_4]|uniref:GroES family chaperonin n=1 Tax=Bradyrhizobium sp. 930_D9_N1_4 TaxID=3240374 RepID=UPI003F887C87
MNNPSGVYPTEYKVLIQPIKVEERTKGGIFLPDEHKDREQFAQMQGVLVAVSPLAFTYAGKAEWGDAEKPKPGDKVMFAKFAGAAVKGKDGADYRIVNDKDVSAVLA